MIESFNIINTDDIKTFLLGFNTKSNLTEVHKWLLSKRLIRDLSEIESTVTLITELPDDLTDSQKWVKDAFEQGKKLYTFKANSDLINTVDHIIDWLNWCGEIVTRRLVHTDVTLDQQRKIQIDCKKILKAFSAGQTPLTEAKEQSEDWTDNLKDYEDIFNPNDKLKKNILSTNDEKTVFVYESYNFKELYTREALSREGDIMDHCVGSYAPKVALGRCQIFSLRDSSNNPHATIEVVGKEMQNIKGKTNQVPIPKYKDAIVAFLNYLALPPSYGCADLANMGLLWDMNRLRYGDFTTLATKIYESGNFQVFAAAQQVQAVDRRIGMIFTNRTHSVVNTELSVDQKMMLSGSVAEALNALKNYKKFFDQNKLPEILNTFSLLSDPIDNRIKHISKEFMTHIFTSHGIKFYQRDVTIYLEVDNKFLSLITLDTEFSKPRSGMFKYRHAIKEYLNNNLNEIPNNYMRQDYLNKILLSTGLIFTKGRFDTVVNAYKKVRSGEQPIYFGDGAIYVLDNNRPIARANFGSNVVDHITGVSDRYEQAIPDRVTAAFRRFVQKYNISSDVAQFLKSRGIDIDYDDHNAKLQTDEDAVYETASVVILQARTDANGRAQRANDTYKNYIVKPKQGKAFRIILQETRYPVFHDIDYSGKIAASAIDAIIEFMNIDNVRWPTVSAVDVRKKLIDHGIGYNEVDKRWIRASEMLSKMSTIKMLNYKVTKEEIAQGEKSHGQEVRYNIVKDQKIIAIISAEVRSSRKQIYNIKYVEREEGIELVCNFLTVKSNSERITISTTKDFLAKFGIKREDIFTFVPSNESEYVQQFRSGELVLNNGNRWIRSRARWSLYAPLGTGNEEGNILDVKIDFSGSIISSDLTYAGVTNATALQKRNMHRDVLELAMIAYEANSK